MILLRRDSRSKGTIPHSAELAATGDPNFARSFLILRHKIRPRNHDRIGINRRPLTRPCALCAVLRPLWREKSPLGADQGLGFYLEPFVGLLGAARMGIA